MVIDDDDFLTDKISWDWKERRTSPTRFELSRAAPPEKKGVGVGTGGGHFRRPWSKQLKSFTIQEISFTHVDRVEKTTIFRDRAVMLYDVTVRQRNNWSPIIIILIIFFSFLIIIVDVIKVSVNISFKYNRPLALLAVYHHCFVVCGFIVNGVYNSEIKFENVLDKCHGKIWRTSCFLFIFVLLRSSES